MGLPGAVLLLVLAVASTSWAFVAGPKTQTFPRLRRLDLRKGAAGDKWSPLRASPTTTTTPRSRSSLIERFGWDRKRLLRALTSLDKGEFRWELLTPWVTDRTLTRADKVIICATFVGVAVGAQNLLEPQTALPQHLSYVLNFFSYTIGNQVGYRLIAILASAFEILAYDERGFQFAEDAIPDGYNAVFILVNLYYVMRWMLNRIDAVGGVLDPLEEELLQRCFEPLGVGPYQYLKLLERATWVRPSARTPLTVEGEPVEQLFVSISGDFDVVTNGQRVASIPPFQVIGEVAALENLQSTNGDFHQAARATVLAEAGSLYVSWSHSALYELQDSDAEFARAIRLAISRTLSHKLGSARRSAGALLNDERKNGRRDDDTAALRVLPVVAPEQERIYNSCFARRGFDDGQAFSNLMRLASKQKTLANDLDVDLEGDDDSLAKSKSSSTATMVALARGKAVVLDDQGVKLQSLTAPALVGVEAFAETFFIVGDGQRQRQRRRQSNRTNRRLRLEPNAEFYRWTLTPTVKQALRSDPALRASLNQLYLATVQDAPQRAQAIIAEVPVLAPSLQANATGGDVLLLP